jgi:hypothetical protein
MKRQFTSLAVTAAILSGSMVTPIALNNVKAASVQQKQTVLIEKAMINGKFSNLHYQVTNKAKIYSATDLAHRLSASMVHKPGTSIYTFSKVNGKTKWTVSLTAKSTTAIVNGKKVKLAKAPIVIGASLFVDAIPFVKHLGGDALADTTLFVSTNGAIKFSTERIQFDGAAQSVKTITVAGKQWYSVSDFAKFTGAAIKTDKSNQVFLSKNKKSVQIGQTPIKVKGLVYADLNELVKSLGGDLLSQKSGKFVSVAGLISGDSTDPQWIDNSTLLMTNSDADGTYAVNVKTKKVLFKLDGTDVTVSPDGKKAVYSDENGYVYLADLSTSKVTALNNTDTNPKFDFVWSHDGSKVYFIQGSKMSDIASISLSDGAITTIYTDSRTSKADLALSPDGNKLLYTVGKEGTTTYDPTGSDVSGIDLSGTETQVNVIDLTAAEKTAVALTASTENKVFPAFLANGMIVYTGYDTEDDSKLPTMYLIDTHSTNTITPILTQKDIASATVTPQGKLVTVINETNGKQTIYTFDPTTKKLTKIAQSALNISSLSYSPDGKTLAVSVEGADSNRILVLTNGEFQAITK